MKVSLHCPYEFKQLNLSTQVYLPAIVGYVPPQMVRAIAVFLDFCYIVRCDVQTEDSIDEMEDALAHFHEERVIFEEEGVIQLFGAPNGLCSSITESKHIKAVKEPWRRSSHYEALGQMLLTNQ